MRFAALLLVLVNIIVVGTAPAHARPPFFIRFVELKETEPLGVIVADVVNPRNASVLLKAFVRQKGELEILEDGTRGALPSSLLMQPASRRAVSVRLADLVPASGGASYELVIEQQPTYFAGKTNLGQPDSMTVTSYVVAFDVKQTDGAPVVEIGKVQRALVKRQTE